MSALIEEIAGGPPAAIVDDARWTRALGDVDAFLSRIAAAAAARAPETSAGCAILFTDDATLHRLNRDFRGKDKPTNVLSFPNTGAPGYAGDIAISFDACAAESAAEEKPFADRAAHLLVHGMMHLAGYDHESEAEAERMERIEALILGDLGISDPYTE